MTATHTPATPRDAAAMALLSDRDDPKVFWVRRSRRVSFMALYHAFPGGQRDELDCAAEVAGAATPEQAALMACAAREVFEETGVLVARGVEKLTSAELAALRSELIENEASFCDLLDRHGLKLGAELLTPLPRWVTPPSSPRRFSTWFFAAWLPEGQEASVIDGELESGEWLRPREALAKWRDGECLIATPVMQILESLAAGVGGFAERLRQIPEVDREQNQRIELREGFLLVPLLTPTLPPATHTNCFIVGGDEVVVIDPGSPYEDEQRRLDEWVERLIGEGRRVREIILTHLHPDHTGGARHLAEKYNLPVAAHRLTAEAIANEVRVDRLIEDGDLIVLGGEPGWNLRALWTPGHARGHLCFHEERTGTVITGDLVVGLGTVVIAPPEGNLSDYLASLRRLLALPRLNGLFPAHGPVLAEARGKIEQYVAHRLEREAAIVKALGAGARTIPEIVKFVYTDVPESLHRLAESSVLAHLEKLEAEGRAAREGQQFTLCRQS
jgi:endoribonuclease LACTB2